MRWFVSQLHGNIHGVQRFAQHISPEFGIKCLRNEISLVVYHWLLEQLCYIALFMAIFAAHSAALFILREGLLASNHRFSACLSGNTLSYRLNPSLNFRNYSKSVILLTFSLTACTVWLSIQPTPDIRSLKALIIPSIITST